MHFKDTLTTISQFSFIVAIINVAYFSYPITRPLNSYYIANLKPLNFIE